MRQKTENEARERGIGLLLFIFEQLSRATCKEGRVVVVSFKSLKNMRGEVRDNLSRSGQIKHSKLFFLELNAQKP